jgi:co-chaperonin GroES (HSP10)
MIVIRKLRPMFTNIVTTMNTYEDDTTTAAGIIDTRKQKGALKEYQTVIAVGNSVRDINPGDVVCINPIRYAQYKHDKNSLKDLATDNPVVGYNFNVVEIDGKQCLLLHDQDIRYVIEEYEEVPDPVPS